VTRKRFRIVSLWIAGVLAGLILVIGVAGVLVLRSSWFYEKVRAGIIGTVEKATGGRVEIASLQFDWKQLRAEVKSLVIHGTEPAGKPPLFRAASVAVGLKIVSAFKRDIDVQYLEVADPRIYLTVDRDGRTNVPEPKVKSAASHSSIETILNLAVSRFEVRNGVFEVESRGQTPFDARGQNLNVRLLYDITGPRYRGNVNVQPLDVKWGGYGPLPLGIALAVTIEKNRIAIDSARLTNATNQVDVSGVIEDMASPHGKFEYDARVSLADVGRIVRVTELRQGAAQVTGSATWAGSSGFSATGKLQATGVEYRDSILRLTGFRLDGPVTANTAGIDATALRISGYYVDSRSRVLGEGQIAHVALRGKNLDLGGVSLAGLGGSFNGEANLRDLNRYTVNGEISGFEVKPVVALFDSTSLPWDGRASGPIHLDGSFRRPKDLRAGGNITVSPALQGDPIHGRVTISYAAETGVLDLGQSTLTLPHSRADLSGALGRQLRVHLETRDLSDLLPALGQSAAKIPVKLQNGVAIFDGTVTGKLDQPQISGHLRATSFIYAGESADGFEADVDVSPDGLRLQNAALARGSLHARFQGSVALADWTTADTSLISASGTLGNAAVTDLAALMNSKSFPATGTLNGSAQVSGTIGEPRIAADLDVAKGSLRGEPFDSFRAHVNYSGRTIAVTSAQIAAGAGQIQLTATFDHAPDHFDTGRLRFQVSSNTMPLDQIHALREARPGIKGAAQVTAGGDIELVAPRGEMGFRITEFHADLSAKGLQLTEQPLGDAHLTVNSQNQLLRAHLESDIAHSTVRGDGEWRLEGDYPGSATVTFTGLNFAQLRPWISASQADSAERFAGSAEGELRVEFPILKPQAMKAELRIPKFELAPAPATGLPVAPLAIRNSGPIVLKMANSVVTVDSAHIVSRGTDLNITGRVSLEQKSPLDLRVNGRIDLGVLQDFSRDLITSGAVLTDATVRGPLNAPQVNGRMEFQNAAFNLADVPNGISNAKGIILFTGDRATIQSLSGETGGGQIELTGFALYSPGPLVFRLHATAHEVRIRYPEGVSTVADASLNFTGTSERSMLAGSITILRAGINLQSDFSSLLAKSAQPVRTPSAQPGLLGGMNFDIQIDTAPDIQFQSALTENLQAEANLKLRGTASNPALLGRVNITQGQLTFFGVKYSINQGSIAFYNPVKIEPILDIDLETKARGIDITLTVSGPATKPALTPRSDPPLQFNEIVALLATGRTPTSDPTLLTQQSSDPQSWQQIGASALLGSAIANPVAGRLQRFFGVSKLRIDPTLSGVENNPQARLTLEQQVTPDITFTYITNVTTSNPQVIRVEWSFSKQWSAVALREENGLFGLDFFYKRRFK
jgi:translocation and assembly module TamB